jgi:ribosome biogenesis GTPase
LLDGYSGSDGKTHRATIIRTGPGLYLALTRSRAGDETATTWACSLRGKLRSRLEREGDSVYIGDEVLLDRFEPRPGSMAGMDVNGTALIESILPRKTTLFRLAPPSWPETTLLKQTLAVNVDLVVVVAAAVAPPLKTNTIDRHLLLAAQAGIEGAVCINKADHIADAHDRERVEDVKSALEARGVKVILTSAETGYGLKELHGMLIGRTSVFTGPSGVGKTSILKSICPGLEAKTLAISASTRKGRHSTTFSSLIDIGGGYVADLPGLRAIGFWNLHDRVVRSEFRDVEEIARECQFSDCSHRGEPGCAVRAALSEGLLSEDRFAEYTKVMRDAKKSRAGKERAGGAGRKVSRNRQLSKRMAIEDATEEALS